MKNVLLDLLNITDDNVIVDSTIINGYDKTINLSTIPKDHFCDFCGCKMRSKGIEKRSINHPILQDGTIFKIIYHQRRYKCHSCNAHKNEAVSFATKGKQTSKFTYINICNDFKSLTRSVNDVAAKFNISTATARRIFIENVSVERLPLPEVLCIDEVFLNFDEDKKYSVVLLDFNTNEPIDIIVSRRSQYINDYFSNISLSERRKVKVIVCDMYKPYIRLKERFFPNAILVVDSFHVISHLNRQLSLYLFKLKKQYQLIDKNKLSILNERTNNAYESMQASKEVYLLQKYSWIILKNESKLNLNKKLKYNKWFCGKWSIKKVRDELFALDPKLLDMYRLKERYIAFNSNYYANENEVKEALKSIISEYKDSKILIFEDFAKTLSKHFIYIVNSFNNDYTKSNNRRLSNGPIEGFNRLLKDLKRNSRGVSNFEFTRARVIWSTRKNCPFKG